MLNLVNPGKGKMMAKTLTIRLSDEEEAKITEVFEQCPGLNTYSKLMIHCTSGFIESREYQEDLHRQIEDLEHQVEVYKGIIDSARNACAVVVDKTAQQDLLEYGEI